jgi:peptidoglycan hydrolase CwlO-like protein
MAIAAVSLLAVLSFPAGASADRASSAAAAQSVQTDINNLNVQLAQRVQQYKDASAKLDELNTAIDANQQVLEKTVHDLVVATDVVDKRAAGIYKRGDVSPLEVIFNSKSLSDFAQQLDLLLRIGNRDAKIENQIIAEKKQVDEKVRQLEVQRADQQKQTNDLAAQKNAIDAQITNKTNFLACFLQDIANLDAAEAAAADKRAAAPAQRHTGAKLYDVIPNINSYWNQGSGPLAPGERSDHTQYAGGHGVWLTEYNTDAFDLMCGDGVTVSAAHSGTVTYVGYERGGVTIVEGSGFATTYAHSAPYTVQGQYVTAGQAIAQTDAGFGHVHFELVDNGVAVPAGDYYSYF